MNPAFAGTATCPRLSLNYRNEWPDMPYSFQSYSVSYDQELATLNGGLGLNVLYDKTSGSVWNNLYVSGMYAYTLKLNRKLSLKAALQASFIQKSIAADNLLYGDMIDGRRGFVLETNDLRSNGTKNLFDVSSGLLFYSDHFHLGLAAFHLAEPNESLLNDPEAVLQRRYTASAGYISKDLSSSGTEITWSPNVSYMQQGSFSQLSVGNYLTINSIVLGLWSRLDDSYILLGGLQLANWSLGYSYDITTSSLKNRNSGGSHEMSFTYTFSCSPPKKKFRTVICPSF
jgi:type IX secretion system PorP/SprF family membrane protein